MGCDDLDRFGWERVEEFLDRDGILGFRLIAASKADELRSYLMKRDCRLDTWDVFLADRAAALAGSEAILSRGPPDALIELARPTEPESEYTGRIQALMPFSGSLLTGAVGPATTVAIGDRDGNVVAAAHGYQ